MKKLCLLICLSGVSAIALADEVITVGASPVPHAELLKYAKPLLAKQGYTLKVTEFSDYVTPNLALSQKQLDANFFQHQPYLTQYDKDHGTNLVALVKVHLEPMGVYANSTTEASLIKSKKAVDTLNGSKVGVPSDPTNEGRTLNLLQSNGIIKIKSGVAYPTKKDIVANPYNVKIIELDPAMLPRALKGNQLDIAVINSNFALSAGMQPTKDALFIETKDSPFANIVVIRPDEVNEPKIKALAKVMNSPEMKQYIVQKYNGQIIPAF